MRVLTYAATVLFSLACAALALPAQSVSVADKVIVFAHVTVIDATGRRPQKDMTVIVKGDRISKIRESSRIRLPRNAEIVEGRGQFLIPGLWNMHVHLGDYEKAKRGLAVLMASGITGVRDMGSPLEDIVRLRDEAKKGVLVGPSMIVAGPLLNGRLPFKVPFLLSVENPEKASEAVTALKRNGVDFIKVADSLSRDEYFAIASKAKQENIPFAGHVPPAITAREASDAGQKSIEHLGGRFQAVLISCSSQEDLLQKRADELLQLAMKSAFEGKEPDDSLVFRAPFVRPVLETYSKENAETLFRDFVRNPTWQVPTLVAIQAFWNRKDLGQEDLEWGEQMKAKQLQVVGAMRLAGAGILAGTDVPVEAEPWALQEELGLLVKSGLSPMEALQSATRNPAQFLGRLGSLGTIEKGKKATLTLLGADPLEDILNTKQVIAVVIDGKIVHRSPLLRSERH